LAWNCALLPVDLILTLVSTWLYPNPLSIILTSTIFSSTITGVKIAPEPDPKTSSKGGELYPEPVLLTIAPIIFP